MNLRKDLFFRIKIQNKMAKFWDTRNEHGFLVIRAGNRLCRYQNVGRRKIVTEQSAGPAAGDLENCSRMLCQIYFLFRLFLLPSPNLEHLSGILPVFRYDRIPFQFL